MTIEERLAALEAAVRQLIEIVNELNAVGAYRFGDALERPRVELGS